QQKMVGLEGDIETNKAEAYMLDQQLKNLGLTDQDRNRLISEKQSKQNTAYYKTQELNAMEKRVNAVHGKPGYFTLLSPINGTVLDSTFEADLTGRPIKPNEPILRIGNKSKQWDIELKIPQKHIGQVLQAYDKSQPEKPLDVDVILRSSPTHTYK